VGFLILNKGSVVWAVCPSTWYPIGTGKSNLVCVVTLYSAVRWKGAVMERKKGVIGAGSDWKREDDSRLPLNSIPDGSTFFLRPSGENYIIFVCT